MKILLISTLASEFALDEAQRKQPQFSAYAVQKFNRLIAEGLVRCGCEVIALSTFFLPGVNHGFRRRDEIQNGVRIKYVPSPASMLLRRPWMIIYCFFHVLWWGVKEKENKAVVCDVLNISACIGAITAARIVGLDIVGIMTDMPGIGVGNSDDHSLVDPKKAKLSISARMNRSYLDRFSHYVFLTEAMNDVVNKHRRPYIVMEGLVDARTIEPQEGKKANMRIVIYAGGLYERYGIKLLVEGFIKAHVDNSELWLYGDGPFVKEISTYQGYGFGIVYKGIRPNNEVVHDELSATLLVNPRPTNEEFALYSFPSKNMEYLVSGTPVLTTMLPGMPEEYYPHVYLFNKGESVDGYAEVLRDVLSKPSEELWAKGKEARSWVLENKNNVRQAERIVRLLKNEI